MSPEEAYAEALRRIREAENTGATSLDLSHLDCLRQLPRELERLMCGSTPAPLPRSQAAELPKPTSMNATPNAIASAIYRFIGSGSPPTPASLSSAACASSIT